MRRVVMQVFQWGKSLAVRLPKTAVEDLDQREGDQIEISTSATRAFDVSRDRATAIQRLRELRRPFPDGFTFERPLR